MSKIIGVAGAGGTMGGGDEQAEAMAAVAADTARPSRWNGRNRRPTSAGGMTCPELATDGCAHMVRPSILSAGYQ